MWLLTFCFLSLPNTNVEPERGAFINKHLLRIYGYSLKEETLETLRIIKYYIIEKDGICNVNVTKEMINSCENARSCYDAHLLEQRQQEELTIAEIEAEKVQVDVKESVDVLNQEIEILVKGIEIAQRSITEGNEELGEIMRSKTIDHEKLLGCQSKIIGVKRKAELSPDKKEIEAKKKAC